MRRQVAAVRGGRRRSRGKAVGAQPGRSHAMSSACHVIIAIAIAGLALPWAKLEYLACYSLQQQAGTRSSCI